MKLLIFGSTGRTGRCLVQQALAQGHEVTAFARDPSKLPIPAERLRVVQGDVLDLLPVREAIKGQDAVLSALGTKRTGPRTVFSEGVGNIIRTMETHGVRRIICLSAAGALKEDSGSLVGNALLGVSRMALKRVYQGHGRQLAQLMESHLDWIAVRAVLLTNGPWTGHYRVVLQGIPRRGYRISRADVADFMLRQVASEEYLRRLPAIAY